jgi:hypothetical protein
VSEAITGPPVEPHSQTHSPGKEYRGSDGDVAYEEKQSRRDKNFTSGQDFIKRNIELAGDAGGSLAMTEEEKKRLEVLLGEDDACTSSSESQEPNKGAVVAFSGYGYDQDNLEKLWSIDSKLNMYSSGDVDRTGSVLSTAWSQHRSNCSDTTGVMEEDAVHTNQGLYGGSLVAQVKVERDEQTRLKEIDSQLKELGKINEEASPVPALTRPQLDQLLALCRFEQSSTPLPSTLPEEEVTVVEDL